MFIEALSITPKTWKQQRYPSVDECINCGTSNGMVFSAKKKKKSKKKAIKT